MSIRWQWRKRKRGQPFRAIDLILRLRADAQSNCRLWIGTALFAIGFYGRGLSVHLLPRLKRAEAELMYVWNLDWGTNAG